MKHIKLFEQFIGEKNSQFVNEAHGDPIRTMEKVKAYLEAEGETVEVQGSKLIIELPNQTKALPPKYNKIIQKVIKMRCNRVLYG
jgi:hypothetical protein